MIKDEDLKSSVDYSEGQKRAAHRVLVELVNIFQEYEDESRVVGGWVPDLMFPKEVVPLPSHIPSFCRTVLSGVPLLHQGLPLPQKTPVLPVFPSSV